MTKEGIFENQDGIKNTEKLKIWVNAAIFSSLKFCKLFDD